MNPCDELNNHVKRSESIFKEIIMKVANLTRNTSSLKINSLLAAQSFHHTSVEDWGSCVMTLNTIKGICKDVSGSNVDALVIREDDEWVWNSFSYNSDTFQGWVFVVTERSTLRCIQADKRDLRSSAERQSDQNHFSWKQQQRALNSL